MREKRMEALTCSKSRTEPGVYRPDQNEFPRLLRRTFLHIARRRRCGGRASRDASSTSASSAVVRWVQAPTTVLSSSGFVSTSSTRTSVSLGGAIFSRRLSAVVDPAADGCSGDARAHDGGRRAIQSDAARTPDVLDELFPRTPCTVGPWSPGSMTIDDPRARRATHYSQYMRLFLSK